MSRRIIYGAGARSVGIAITSNTKSMSMVSITSPNNFKSTIGSTGSCIYKKSNNKNMNMNNHTRQMNYMSTFTAGGVQRIKIPFVLQRGGTSKGIFFQKDDLPDCPKLRDIVIKDIFGSPDIRQIDGLGGADVLTSKVAIISKRNNNNSSNNNYNYNYNNNNNNTIVFADVNYLFGQVEFGSDENSRVLYDVNCGNISAGVGPYAIEEGLIEVNDQTVTATATTTNDNDDDTTRYNYHQKVRIYNVNTNKIIVAEVPVQKVNIQQQQQQSNQADTTTRKSQHITSCWIVIEDGTYQIDGVPGSSAYLPIDFSNCVGTLSTSFSNNDDDDDTDGDNDEESDSDNDNDSDSDSDSNNLPSLLLPTGNVQDTVIVDNHSYDVSLIDVANFVVHIDGRQLGLVGNESSIHIMNNTQLWNTVRKIRYEAAKLVLKEDDITLTKPFTSVVFPFLQHGQQHEEEAGGGGGGYESIRGDRIDNDNSDNYGNSRDATALIHFRSFVLFCDHVHKAYPGTAGNATAAAALIDGTVVNDVMKFSSKDSSEQQHNDGNDESTRTTTTASRMTEISRRTRNKIVTIGHPSGRMSIRSEIEETITTVEKQTNIDYNTAADISIGATAAVTDTTTSTACATSRKFSLKRSIIGRTSRRIAEGYVYLKPDTVRRLNNT
jgi:2-methylaconitate cis-trans-isomerase PrpF